MKVDGLKSKGIIMGNQTICSVLEEMRMCSKTANYSYLPGLVENAQALANHMESALDDKRDLISYNEDRHRLRKEILKLKKEKNKLNKKLGKDKKEDENTKYY